jgi:outer membrane protein assembly factor BamB
VVAVDSSGNVLVTGTSNGGAGGEDFYTAKYAATNGALLWEQRYSGAAHFADIAQALAVDGSGNVVVTGVTDSNDYGPTAITTPPNMRRRMGYCSGRNATTGRPMASLFRPASLGPNGMVLLPVLPTATMRPSSTENLPPVSVALVPTASASTCRRPGRSTH